MIYKNTKQHNEQHTTPRKEKLNKAETRQEASFETKGPSDYIQKCGGSEQTQQIDVLGLLGGKGSH